MAAVRRKYGLTAYRYVLYMVCICALGMFAMHAIVNRVECPLDFQGKFARQTIQGSFIRSSDVSLSGGDRSDAELALMKDNLQLHRHLNELRERVRMLESDLLVAHEQDPAQDKLKRAVEHIKNLSKKEMVPSFTELLEEQDRAVEEETETDWGHQKVLERGSETTSSADKTDETDGVIDEVVAALNSAASARYGTSRNDNSEGTTIRVQDQNMAVSEIAMKAETVASEEEPMQEEINNKSDDGDGVASNRENNLEWTTDDNDGQADNENENDDENEVEKIGTQNDEGGDGFESDAESNSDGDTDLDEDSDDDSESMGGPGFEDLGSNRFRMLAQVNPKLKKQFRSIGTKFVSMFRAWEASGWKHKYDDTSLVSLYLTKPVSKVPSARGKMISQISRSSCIGGTKGAQLRCKVKLAEKHGCYFNDLHISPDSYDLQDREDCYAFMNTATKPENEKKLWILKDGGSFHGKRIKVYEGLKREVKQKYGKCLKDKVGAGTIMMEYVHQPVLFSGRKFDLRTFLLIGSTKPFIVFYHDGFVRRSNAVYKNTTFSKLGHITNHRLQDSHKGHFWGFDALGQYLYEEQGFPQDFMQNEFRIYTKKATNFVFQAARAQLKRRSGSFMLFGLDWLIDMNRQIHFLEANGNPTISNYEGTGLGPKIWNDMAEMLTKLHRDPDLLEGELKVANDFRYGNWDLVFNEAEEVVTGESYNVCEAFKL